MSVNCGQDECEYEDWLDCNECIRDKYSFNSNPDAKITVDYDYKEPSYIEGIKKAIQRFFTKRVK